MRLAFVIFVLLIFGAGVTCAAICGEQFSAGRKHADGTKCDECISTAFVTSEKTADNIVSLGIACPADSFVILKLVSEAVTEGVGSTVPPSPHSSIITLRAFRI